MSWYFNFGPSSIQTCSVGELVQRMSIYWDSIKWCDESEKSKSIKEAGLLKLNCDKAYTLLNWTSKWDLEKTIKETVNWYKAFYLNQGKIEDLSLKQITDYQLLLDKIK